MEGRTARSLSARAFLLMALSLGCLQAQDVVPRPLKIARLEGGFVLKPGTRIAATGQARAEAEMLRDYLRPATDFTLTIVASAAGIPFFWASISAVKTARVSSIDRLFHLDTTDG